MPETFSSPLPPGCSLRKATALQDLDAPGDGKDPFAACRWAVERIPQAKFDHLKASGKSPATAQREIVAACEQVLREAEFSTPKVKADCERFTREVQSPAFLRYLAGLMGAV